MSFQRYDEDLFHDVEYAKEEEEVAAEEDSNDHQPMSSDNLLPVDTTMKRGDNPKLLLKREEGRCDLFERALGGHHVGLLFTPSAPWPDVERMFQNFKHIFTEILNCLLSNGLAYKIQFSICVIFRKESVNPFTGVVESIFDNKWMSLRSRPVDSIDDLLSGEVTDKFLEMIARFTRQGSNWLLENVKEAVWRLVKYNRINFYSK